jgi:hypothetical protein
LITPLSVHSPRPARLLPYLRPHPQLKALGAFPFSQLQPAIFHLSRLHKELSPRAPLQATSKCLHLHPLSQVLKETLYLQALHARRLLSCRQLRQLKALSQMEARLRVPPLRFFQLHKDLRHPQHPARAALKLPLSPRHHSTLNQSPPVPPRAP